MRKTTVAALVGMVLSGAPAWATQWAQDMFAESEHDFGTVARAATAEYAFKLTNPYQEDVRIADVRSSCGCTSVWVKDNKRVLKTHESGAIVAHINSDKFLGSKGATITVTLDRPRAAQAQLRVRAYIRDDVSLRPGSVQLGTVKQGTATQRSIEVVCSGRGGLRPVDVRSTNPHLSARLVSSAGGWQSTYRLDVRLGAQAPAGFVRDQLVLVLSDRRTQVPVPVEGRVVAGVTVSPERLLIGLVEPGEEVRKMVIVRGTTPFRIKNVRSESDAFRLDLPPQGSAKPVHVIPVTFTAGHQPGRVVGTIHIETDQGTEPVAVTANAEVQAMPPALVRVEAGQPAPVRPSAAAHEDAGPPASDASSVETASATATVEQPTSPAVTTVAHDEAPTDSTAHADRIPSLFGPPGSALTEDAQPPSAPTDDARPPAAPADDLHAAAAPSSDAQSAGNTAGDLRANALREGARAPNTVTNDTRTASPADAVTVPAADQAGPADQSRSPEIARRAHENEQLRELNEELRGRNQKLQTRYDRLLPWDRQTRAPVAGQGANEFSKAPGSNWRGRWFPGQFFPFSIGSR
jgi:hypothetical protein